MEQLTVRILDRDYRLSCEPSEKATLLAAVEHVATQMQAIRAQGKIAGVERIAVFAALNIASALLTAQASSNGGSRDRSIPLDGANGAQPNAVADPEIARRMQSLNVLLDSVLTNQEALF